jgi:hypothetical protein
MTRCEFQKVMNGENGVSMNEKGNKIRAAKPEI